MNKLPASLLIGIVLLLILFSCKKDPYEIGFDLLPPSDTLNVRTTDTCTVEAFSVIVDSVRTDKVSSLLLGSMLDPVFGKTTGSFYTQFELSSEEPDFGDRPVLDSLVLMLFYNNYYGDTLTRQNVKVYELSDDLVYDSVHFSNDRLNTYPILLADQNFYPKPDDSVKVGDEKFAAHLRINLSRQTSYLGNKIISAPASALASNSEFVKFFKGLYVQSTPVNNGGSLFSFSVTNATSKLVVYFHDGDNPTHDSLSYELIINDGCGRFLHYDHNRYLDANQDLKQQILNHDSTQGRSKLFLQGLGGVRIKVKFPFMKDFGHGKVIAVNDALLMFKNYETDTTFAPPYSLTLLKQDSVGAIGHLPDEYEGTGYFGGTYNATSRTYFFRITQHMQKILLNSYTKNYDLYMYVTNPRYNLVTPNRIILNGTNPMVPGDNTARFQLKVTYTILN